MTKEDWIILRLIREAKIEERYTQEDYIKATMYLKDKYGAEKVIKNLDILEKERINELYSVINKAAEKITKQLAKKYKLKGQK
jgi:ribosome-associated translation inhibitor RaiA